MKKIKKERILTMPKIIIIFLIVISSMSIGYSYLSEQLSVAGKGNLVVEEKETTDRNINVSYDVNNWYSDGKFYYIYQVTLTNMTEEDVDGWTASVDLPEDVIEVNCWDATCELVDHKLLAKNIAYNSILKPNVGVTFGVSFNTSSSDVKIDKGSVNDEVIVDETKEEQKVFNNDDLKIRIEESGSWNNGNEYYKQYTAYVKNESIYNIKSWKFSLNFDNTIKLGSSWNVNYVEKDTSILFSNGDWNGKINSNEEISFGFQIISNSPISNTNIKDIVGEM